MTPERKEQILDVWTSVQQQWRPARDGNRFTYTISELDVHFEFHHDHLGRVYCEGLYIDIFSRLRKSQE